MFIRTVETDPTLENFRAEVREFIQTNLPKETRRKQALGQHIERDEYGAWLRKLGERGWLTAKWPKEHGGLDWGPDQAAIFKIGRAHV